MQSLNLKREICKTPTTWFGTTPIPAGMKRCFIGENYLAPTATADQYLANHFVLIPISLDNNFRMGKQIPAVTFQVEPPLRLR